MSSVARSIQPVLFITVIILYLLISHAAADRLVPQQPENQLVNSIEHINVIGPIIKDITLTSEKSNGYLHNGILRGSFDGGGAAPTDAAGTLQDFGEVVSQTSYQMEERTNGGYLEQMYALGYDTKNTFGDTFNLETYWIMTYETALGSTLAATERASLDVAGNYETTANNRRCIFAWAGNPVMPSFCNVVSAQSTFAAVTSMTVQTPLKLRDTAATADTPLLLMYEVSVDPNAASGNQYADGQVGVTLSASVREANRYVTGRYYMPGDPDWNNNYWDDEARVTNYVDTITVTGGITRLAKSFAYASTMGM